MGAGLTWDGWEEDTEPASAAEPRPLDTHGRPVTLGARVRGVVEPFDEFPPTAPTLLPRRGVVTELGDGGAHATNVVCVAIEDLLMGDAGAGEEWWIAAELLEVVP